jgi:Ca-activated chloride channel family protein
MYGIAIATSGALLLPTVALVGQGIQPPEAKGLPAPAIQADKQVAPPVRVGDPQALKTTEGKTGWKVIIPGNRPLATPAVVDGRIFIGGGFGSHEFYAFDAATGKMSWLYRTGDDGPTAAVVEGDFVAFNTESCELEILDRNGNRIWKKWLGDPLMSMPAISRGRIYMAYPDSKGNRGHRLACFDIKDGKECWTQPIAGEIITAPVIDDDRIYLTTLEGTMYCFNEKDGALIWSERKNATSSPAVFQGKIFFSQRNAATVKDKDGKEVQQQMEALAGRGTSKDAKVQTYQATAQNADYLDMNKRTAQSGVELNYKSADAGVGFASAPAAAGLSLASGNIGQATVCGVWSYQGSRPFIHNGNLISTMGDNVKCVDPKTEKVLWTKVLHPLKDGKPVVDAALTPPAIANGKLFVGTTRGEIICLSAASGQELWRATVGEPIVFQPSVAHGRVYASSSTGSLFCIETGDSRDHGWLMWGGNAQHNGPSK